MTLTLYGGPADGQDFTCSRAPALLRAVQAQSGKWDVLDQLDDEPRPTETIHVYEQTRNHGGAFICPGGYSADATYRHIFSSRPHGEVDELIRGRDSWRRFVAAYFGLSLGPDGRRVADLIQFPARDGGQG